MLAADALGELPGKPLEVGPGDDVAFDGRHAVDGFVRQKNNSATTM